MDLTKKKNRIFMFLITWFFGIFGVHWFVQKNYKKGCIYFITIGGFVIYWIYDTFKAFMNIFKNHFFCQKGDEEECEEEVEQIIRELKNKF